jgi:hypothetical protein
MIDNITLPRAVVEEVRSAIRGFYNKYSDEAVHEDAPSPPSTPRSRSRTPSGSLRRWSR